MEKNIILFVGKYIPSTTKSIKDYETKTGKKFRTALIYQDSKKPKKEDLIDILIPCKLKSAHNVQKVLDKYNEQIVAVTCRGEDQIEAFTKVIPNLPYIKTPTTESLLWSSDKLLMRKRLYNHNRKIAPKHIVVKDYTEKSISKIIKKVGFPLIVKPTGLAGSRLVTLCYHKEELEKTLKTVFKKVKKVHKDTGGNWEPKVLVEQFIEGIMYSVDAYVNQKGIVYFCPLVKVITGKEIGSDDFFGYKQMTPVNLKTPVVEEARSVAKQSIQALGLRNTTAHIEMLRTEDGWKIIEVGARVGGFRHDLYKMAYGIDHAMNDILIRMGKTPILPKKITGYAMAMKFFASKEGKLVKVHGLRKAKKLDSYKKKSVNKKPGDRCTFARNGGVSVFNIILFNKNKSQLLADVRRLEKMIKIETK
jgi:biotin carboxylase